MGKRIVATLLLLMLVFTTVSTAFAKTKGTKVSGVRYVTAKNGKKVNVRKEPDLGSRRVAVNDQLEVGTQVTLVEKTQDSKGNTWYKIKVNGKTAGWMMGEFLSTTKPKTLADKAKEELKKKVEPMKEKILDMAKSSPNICGINGCTAKAEKIFGEWRFAQVKGEHGEYYYRDERYISVVHCEKGHSGGYWQYRYK